MMDTLGVSWPMLAFALAVSVTAGLLFGILPAVQATHVNIAGNIGSGMRTTDGRGQRILSGLIVAQVAITVILLIGSGLLLKSFATLRAVEPGFDSQSLLTTELRLASDKYPNDAGRIEFFSSIIEEIRAIPGVSDVAVISRLPIQNPGNNPYAYAAGKPQPDPRDRRGAYWRTVMPGYFGAMGIPLRRGRGIEMSDTAESPRVLVINETMARTLFPNEDPLGKLVRIHQHSEDYEVVGVVGDVRLVGTRFTPRMAMYASYLQQPTLTMRIAVRTAVEPTSLAEAVRKVVWSHDRDVPVVGLSSMDEFISNTIANDGVVALSVSLFATVSVLLSALGLYGVLTYSVHRRAREIGLRIILGAETSDVVRPVLRRGLSLVATGFALGLLGAFWATRLIQRLLFNVQPTDAATYVFVFVFFALVGFVACLIPALRAVKADPVSALLAQ